jgi:hypothetical protein
MVLVRDPIEEEGAAIYPCLEVLGSCTNHSALYNSANITQQQSSQRWHVSRRHRIYNLVYALYQVVSGSIQC